MAVRIAQALNVEIEELYKVIPQHYFSAILFFVNENIRFVKFPPQWTKANISIHQELLIKRRRNRCMKNVVLDELMRELNWRERIIVKLFKKTFYKMYKIGVTFGFNSK